MLDLWFREHLENRAKTDISKLLPGLEHKRRTYIAHYAFCLFAAVIAFSILFGTHVLASRNRNFEHLILTTGITFTAFFVIVTQFLKRNSTFIAFLLRGQAKVSRHIKI